MLAANNTVAEDRMAAVFKKHGAFFAFSNKQFSEAKVEGIKYISLGNGVIVPKENAERLEKDVVEVGGQRIKEDLKKNSVKDIIWRELANHEAQITHSTESTFDALEGYGISQKQVKAEFPAYFNHCIDNDYF